MNDDLRMLVVEALREEGDIRLFVGNNEFYLQRPNFHARIEYILDSYDNFDADDDYCSFASRYSFELMNILFYNLENDTECEIEPDTEIKEIITEYAVIDNWSGSLICLRNALY